MATKFLEDFDTRRKAFVSSRTDAIDFSFNCTNLLQLQIRCTS